MENFFGNPKVSFRIIRDKGNYAPLSFLIPFIGFLAILKVDEFFSHLFTPSQKKVKYSAKDKSITQIIAIAAFCNYTLHINSKLAGLSTLANRIKLKRFPEQSTINRFLNAFTLSNVEEMGLIHKHLFEQYTVNKKEEKVVVDIDGTGIAVTGENFEFARKGYFPGQRGKRGYKITLASAPHKIGSEVLAFTFNPGNISESSCFYEVLYGALDVLGSKEKVECLRMDRHFGSGAMIEYIMDEGLKFVTKIYNSVSTKQWLGDKIEWEEVSSTTGAYEVGWVSLPNCKYKVRVVLMKKKTKKGVSYDAILTNYTLLEKDTVELVVFYNQRQKIEAFFKEDKNCLGIRHLRVKKYEGIWGFLWFAFITNNLLLWFRHYVLGRTPLEKLGFKSLYAVLENLLIHVVRKGKIVKIEFICFNKLQEIFIERALKWIEDFYIFFSKETADRELGRFRVVVYNLSLFWVIFCVMGSFERNSREKKEAAIEWMRQVLAF